MGIGSTRPMASSLLILIVTSCATGPPKPPGQKSTLSMTWMRGCHLTWPVIIPVFGSIELTSITTPPPITRSSVPNLLPEIPPAKLPAAFLAAFPKRIRGCSSPLFRGSIASSSGSRSTATGPPREKGVGSAARSTTDRLSTMSLRSPSAVLLATGAASAFVLAAATTQLDGSENANLVGAFAK